jgi:predicted ABC-type transport system involved in lysophospholipase L1 biosynthesis ATPase subunit
MTVCTNGVHERCAGSRSVAVVAPAGSVRGGLSVLLALLASEEAVSAAVGDVAELGDIDVDQRARVRVFVAA